MINEAIAKIKGEAEKISLPIVEQMAQQVCDYIVTDDRAAAVLQEGKTLEGLKKSFDKFANSKKKDNRSFIGPKESEKLIFDYFGFCDADTSPKKITEEKKATGIIDITKFL